MTSLVAERHEATGLEACAARLLRAARSMGHTPEDAEDLVHDVLVDHLRSAGRFEGRCSLFTWLYGILHRRHIDRLRRKRVAKEAPPLEPSRPEPVDDERRRIVREAVGQLPEPYRQVLRMRYFEGLPYEEIAAVVEAPVGTLKSHVFYGLQKFRAILLEKHGREIEDVL